LTPCEVVFSLAAKSQLVDLEAYLARRFYPRNLERYVYRLAKACLKLNIAPFRGTQRYDLGAGIRRIGFERNVTIYFKVTEEQIIILNVLYRGRTPASLRG
jgi:plasmid stabilization system protein ParE